MEQNPKSDVTSQPNRPYDAIRSLVERHGGSMLWHPKGAGGDWVLQLEGKEATVECRSNRVNNLDRLYVPKVESPATWDDYERDAPLIDHAFWGLVRLFL